MLIRSISAVVMAIFVLIAVITGTPYFETLIFFISIAAIIEWYRLIIVNDTELQNIILLACGILYILLPCLILVWLRNNDKFGAIFIVWFFLVIWATDIGAYIFGKFIGGYKLAPAISPNKTWAGFFGGIVSAVISSFIFKIIFYPELMILFIVLACLTISIIGQIGDLFESWCKRKLGVKDTSNIIPGHGGILDRVDSILLSAPFAAFIAISSEAYDIPWR